MAQTEITKEEFKSAVGQWGIPMKAYDSVLWDNAFNGEDFTAVVFTAGDFKISFESDWDEFTVKHGEWEKTSSSKATAKRVVNFLLELGQPTEVDEDTDLELYRLYKSVK